MDRQPKRYRRFIAWTLIGGCAAYAGLAWIVSSRSRPDPYRFLDGHRPFLSGVNSMRYTREYRVYSWEQDYSSVVAVADKELTGLGFVRSHEKSKTAGYEFASWSKSDVGIYMDPGLSRTRRQAFGGMGRASGGVTVTIDNSIPDNWMAHLRLVLEPSDY